MTQRPEFVDDDKGVAPLMPRQRQKAETRARVLDSARILFERDGVESVTVRMIAEHAGVAVGSVFTGFESKMDLLLEIIAEDLERFNQEAVSAAEATSGSIVDRLMAGFTLVYAYDVAHLAKARDSIALSWTRSPESERRVRTAIAPAVKRISAMLEKAQKMGELGPHADLRLIIDIIFNCYCGNLRRALFDGWGAEALTAHLRAQLALIVAGAR